MKKTVFLLMVLCINTIKSQIIYTDILDFTTTMGNPAPGPSSSLLPIDFNQDGITDVEFSWIYSYSTNWQMKIAGNPFVTEFPEKIGSPGGDGFTKPFMKNELIGPSEFTSSLPIVAEIANQFPSPAMYDLNFQDQFFDISNF